MTRHAAPLTDRIRAVQPFVGGWSTLSPNERAAVRRQLCERLGEPVTDETLLDVVQALHHRRAQAFGEDRVTVNPLPTVRIDTAYDDPALGHPRL